MTAFKSRALIIPAIALAATASLAGCQNRGKGPDGQRLPPEVGQWQVAAAEACRKAGGRFNGFDTPFLTGDFNADGKTDYLMRWSGVDCPATDGRAGQAFRWSGAGPQNDLLLSQADGRYRTVEGPRGDIKQADVKQRMDRAVVETKPAGPDAPKGVATSVWGVKGEETSGEVIERRSADGGVVDTGGREVPQPALG